jgi:predicted dehydrogenase
MSIGIAIYGSNGHQIHEALVKNSQAKLVATAGFPLEKLPAGLREDTSIRHGKTLDDLLNDPRVDLISLCSPLRKDQAQETIRALKAGKHVYAEKPCALTEADLDAIMQTSRETGSLFHEMAGTAFDRPYFAMRKIVHSGRIGEVVQVIAEKSYPYHPDRPQDEAIDGGLIGQCAIHALRMVEHVAGTPIASVTAMETLLGNPRVGDLRMASALMLRLKNGGIASVTANYLNPRGTGTWGDESLRILGTLGMVESTRGGQQTRLVIGNENLGELENIPGVDYLDAFLQTIRGDGKMPLTLEEELSPTRWTIRAKNNLIS